MKILNAILIGIFISACSTTQKDFKGLTFKSIKLQTGKIEFKETLTKKEFQHDILLLRYALEKAYGGKGTIRDDIFNEVGRALKDLSFISTPMEICKRIGEIMSAFPDHHLKAKYRGTYCYNRKVKKINVGKNLNDTINPWKGIKTKNGVYTFAISKFRAGKWAGFHEFVDVAMKKAKVIIVDLRGNGGGDDTIGYEFAERLAGQNIETPIAPDLRRNTPETLTIWDNYLNVLKENSNDRNTHIQLDIYRKENAEKMKRALSGELQEFTTKSIKKLVGNMIIRKAFRAKYIYYKIKIVAQAVKVQSTFLNIFQM